MITISNLYKSFGKHKVLNGLTTTIPANETVALLGANGAGKSTLIKILSGLISYDQGNIEINGIPYKEFHAKNVNKITLGIVPQEIALYETLTVRQNISFWANIYGLSNKVIKEKIAYYLDLLELKSIEKKKVNTLSVGQQKIVSLLCGIIHDPSILFLDEPTVGIDIVHKEKIYTFIRALKKRGITIIYTTHNFSEIPKICDKIAILNRGVISDFGSEEDLITKYNLNSSVAIQIDSPKLPVEFPIEAFRLRGVEIKMEKEHLLSVQGEQSSSILPDILKALYDEQVQVTHLKVNEPSLENIFLQAHKITSTHESLI